MSVTKEAQENIQRLQMLEQNVQALAMQKQQFQAQLFEVESALKEVESSPVAYKVIGGIMFSVEKSVLQGELKGKKELLELRVQTLEKQETQIKEKAKKLQQDVLAGVKE